MSETLEIMVGEVRAEVRLIREQQEAHVARNESRHDELARDVAVIKHRLAGEDAVKIVTERIHGRWHAALHVLLSVIGGGIAGGIGAHLWGK